MKFLTFFLLLNFYTFAQSDVPLTLRAQFNGQYGYTIIGNTHNEFDNWQSPPPACQILTQSSATLNLLPNQNIVAAYLYWSGIGDGTFDQNILLNGVSYSSSPSVTYPEDNVVFSYFGCFNNVTNQVLNTGNGLYTFSNLDLNPIISSYCNTGSQYSGWHMVVIYSQIGLNNRQLNIYDGLNAVITYFNNGVTSLTVNDLNVIDN